MDESHEVVRRLLGAEYDGFDLRNPGLVSHMAGSAALMTQVLRTEGFSSTVVEDGQEMGAGHDVIKDGLGATMHGVWDDAFRRWFRWRHTQGGEEWVSSNWERVQNPFVLAFGIKNHHTMPPMQYEQQHPSVAYKWGLCHLLVACDRTESLLTRPYVRETEGELDADGVLLRVFAAGRPFALEPTATINDRSVNLEAAMRPIIASTFERLG